MKGKPMPYFMKSSGNKWLQKQLNQEFLNHVFKNFFYHTLWLISVISATEEADQEDHGSRPVGEKVSRMPSQPTSWVGGGVHM
jgi:hypothetical protein